MWLGSRKSKKEKKKKKKKSTDKYYDIKWKLRVKILAIYFSNSIPTSEIDDHWLPRIENIQRTIVTWSKRN